MLLVGLSLACAHNQAIDKQAKDLVLTSREQVSSALLAVQPALSAELDNPERPRIALVLGSGGTRGIAHIGVLRVLRREHIPIDFVVGSSVGSIVGALFCSGISQENLEQIAVTSKRRDIFRYVISKNGVIDGARVEAFINRHIGQRSFDELKIPLAVVTTDIKTGEEIVIAHGDVARAVRASCTFPGLMAPMKANGRMLVDGGVVDKLPVTVAKNLGADIVIAVDVTANTTNHVKLTNMVEVLVQTLNVMARQMTRGQAELADVLIRPQVGQLWMLDFKDARKCIDAGVDAGERALPAIRALLSQANRQKKQIAQ